MSIAGIGSHGPGNLTQMLSGLLSRLDTTSKTSETSETTTTNQSTTASVSSNLTGNTKPSLSGMILGTLIGLQGQSDSQSSSSSSSSSTTSTDPVQNLFSAMDSDSDGSVTQSELETYLQQVGGTSEQADSLYSLLNTDSQDGISKSEMASQAVRPLGGGHRGHHGPEGSGGPPPSDTADSSSTSDVSAQLVSLFDSNGDGTVSKSELTDFVTAHGGSESDASTEFAALDTTSSGALTSSNFSDAIEKLQNSYQNDPYASVVSLLDVFSKTAGSTVSVSA